MKEGLLSVIDLGFLKPLTNIFTSKRLNGCVSHKSLIFSIFSCLLVICLFIFFNLFDMIERHYHSNQPVATFKWLFACFSPFPPHIYTLRSQWDLKEGKINIAAFWSLAQVWTVFQEMKKNSALFSHIFSICYILVIFVIFGILAKRNWCGFTNAHIHSLHADKTSRPPHTAQIQGHTSALPCTHFHTEMHTLLTCFSFNLWHKWQ